MTPPLQLTFQFSFPQDYIVNVHGFPEDKDSMIILLDDDNFAPPTFNNIIDAFKILSEESQPGDAVFVQFSGHGGRVLDAPVDAEAESYDEVICPMDYERMGLIRDTLIFKTLLAPMRYGVTLTILIDCCDTGMVLELPYAWNSKSDKRNSSVAKLSMNEDFSFVRFLKVVKTLYESSTFTQLGKTVGSALHPMSPMYNNGSSNQKPADDDRSSGRKNKNKSSDRHNESLFEALTSACINSGNDTVQREDTMMSQGDGSTLATTRKGGDTLLETMMRSCTLLASPADDFSDEDTFKTRTDEDSLYDQSESFESSHLTTEDDHPPRRRSKRRH
jgi:Caspase domain